MSILFKTLTGLTSGPEVPEVKPLTLRNIGTNSTTIKISKYRTPTVDGLQYRMEGEESWLPYTIDTKITVNPNKAVQFQNTNETLNWEKTGDYNYIYIQSAQTNDNICLERKHSIDGKLY